MTRTEMISVMSDISKELGNIIDRMKEEEVSDLKEQELDGISKFEKYICRQTYESLKENKQFVDTMLQNPTIDEAIKVLPEEEIAIKAMGGLNRDRGNKFVGKYEVWQISILAKLLIAFPYSFINEIGEFIMYPQKNTYFNLSTCRSVLEVKCKVLEHASREAFKGINNRSREYHHVGLNMFFDYFFTDKELEIIYAYLGNGINRPLCIKYIESGLDIEILKEMEK